MANAHLSIMLDAVDPRAAPTLSPVPRLTVSAGGRRPTRRRVAPTFTLERGGLARR
jgi:hypothetical protein